MFTCHDCKQKMVKTKGAQGFFWSCASCGGRFVALSILRKTAVKEYINTLWQSVQKKEGMQRRPCGICNSRMFEIKTKANGKELELDVCRSCQFVWFDENEYRNVPENKVKKSSEEALKVKETVISTKAKQQEEIENLFAGPDEWWQVLIAIAGLPVEHHNKHVVRKPPIITWSLAIITIIISSLAFLKPEIIHLVAFVPEKALRYGGLTFLTSFFLHGGIIHLLGNMYFLVIFGDNVEDYLGKQHFFLLLTIASIIGCFVHYLFDPRGGVPLIGASCGISGIIVFYCLTFPKASLGFLLFYIKWIRISASTALMFWIMLQIFMTTQQLSGSSNVSALGHIGGAIVGLIFWFLHKHGPTKK